MQTAHEFFIHELSDMFDAEQKLVKALEEQAEESSNPELKKGFEGHLAQTENQVERLRQVFESIGEESETTECKGIKGLKDEHDAFKEEDPSDDLMDIFNVGAGIKVERYEISSYESLISLARQMKHTEAVKLLTQNLKEEEQTLTKLQGLSKKLKPEEMGMEEEAEEAEGEEASEQQPRRAPARGGRTGKSRRGRSAA
jgi:ferritin-like metal-binding protein YciE